MCSMVRLAVNVQYSAFLVPTSALEGLERFSFMRTAVYETGFLGINYSFFFFSCFEKENRPLGFSYSLGGP